MVALALSAFAALAGAAPLSRNEIVSSAARFEAAHPGATIVRAPSGGIAHASGFAAPRLAPDDEENARRFLARLGLAFGVESPSELETLRVRSTPREGGSAHFRRHVDGLPVFGGEVVVSWRADGAITLVNGSPSLAVAPARRFRATPADARAAALRPEDETRLAGEPAVERGWREVGGRLAPVYRVSWSTFAPPDAFRAYVDGESGRLLYRISRRRSADCGAASCVGASVKAYQDSPLWPVPPSSAGNVVKNFGETLAAPLSGAPLVLKGVRTEAFNCNGDDVNSSLDLCVHTALVDGSGNFSSEPEPLRRDPKDPFAEQSAYVHIDAHGAFLDSLDPVLAATRGPTGIIGFVPGYVNLTSHGGGYDNAYFSPGGGPPGSAGVMVYGLGTIVNIAYDAEIVYHELTHAAVDATAQLEETIDRFGVDTDPGSLNEGTADTFAFANPNVGNPCLARFFARELGQDCLRNADNLRTCRGNGPNDGPNPGRDGEVHDDGQIWSGFSWALYKAAADHGVASAMARALFLAMEDATSHPTFVTYAATVRDKVLQTPGLGQVGAEFVDCTIAQRDIAGCAVRSVPLYSAERAQGVIYGTGLDQTPAPQQYYVDVPCGAVALHLQVGDDLGEGVVYVRHGAPVQFAGAEFVEPQYDWVVAGNHSDVRVAETCGDCAPCGLHTPFGPGRWYLLPAGADQAQFQLGVSLEMPAGIDPPRRKPYVFGDASGVNTCAWGEGPQPLHPDPPPPVDPASLACAEPSPPSGAAPAQCAVAIAQPSARPTAGGCGCGTGSASGALLFVPAVLGWRRGGRIGSRGRGA